MLYGFFSQKATEMEPGMFSDGTRMNRYVIYETPDGKEVAVTAVYDTPHLSETRYKWDDAVCVGPVVKFVRKVK